MTSLRHCHHGDVEYSADYAIRVKYFVRIVNIVVLVVALLLRPL